MEPAPAHVGTNAALAAVLVAGGHAIAGHGYGASRRSHLAASKLGSLPPIQAQRYLWDRLPEMAAAGIAPS